jgi:hypothetical protein
VVTRNGKPVAVIVGVHDEDEIERLLMAYSPRLPAILDESRKQIREGDVLGPRGFWGRGSRLQTAQPETEGSRARRFPLT